MATGLTTAESLVPYIKKCGYGDAQIKLPFMIDQATIPVAAFAGRPFDSWSACIAAVNLNGAELMLHADHTYDKHPWHPRLTGGEARGLGAELRLFGVDPDVVESRALKAGSRVLQPATTKGHGWREVMVEDPDGYVWAVGLPTAPQP